MSESAFDGVDPLTGFLEAGNDLWDVVRVDVTKPQLAILVVLSNCIHKTLLADEEAKVVAATDSRDLDLLAEWHPYWIAHLLPLK